MDTILQVDHLTTGFPSGKDMVKIVNDVSITIEQGSIVGIVGESGCGKSMTARSIMGLLKHPNRILEGSILLQGQDLAAMDPKQMSKIRGQEISMIFQEPMTSLNPVMKVGKQVSEALRLHQKMSKKEAREQVVQMFEKVGISDPEKRYDCYPHELSGGLRQRVMIAMAMICKPKLLIADEPTTALDVTVEAQIMELMRRLRDEIGTSIILISHNLGVVAEMCDYVYVMYAGRIVEQAETVALFDQPQHPYTRGLMNAVGSLERMQPHLDTIAGTVPNLAKLPRGCSFAPRCECCDGGCTGSMPELTRCGPDHYVRCHRAIQGEEQ